MVYQRRYHKRALPIPTLEYVTHFRMQIHTEGSPDALLHVSGVDAGESLRCKVGYLVFRLPDLRTLRSSAAVPRGQNSHRTQYIDSVRISPRRTVLEVDISFRNGRIPPLPKGYSQSLTAVIKSMLNLNVWTLKTLPFIFLTPSMIVACDAALDGSIITT